MHQLPDQSRKTQQNPREHKRSMVVYIQMIFRALYHVWLSRRTIQRGDAAQDGEGRR